MRFAITFLLCAGLLLVSIHANTITASFATHPYFATHCKQFTPRNLAGRRRLDRRPAEAFLPFFLSSSSSSSDRSSGSGSPDGDEEAMEQYRRKALCYNLFNSHHQHLSLLPSQSNINSPAEKVDPFAGPLHLTTLATTPVSSTNSQCLGRKTVIAPFRVGLRSRSGTIDCQTITTEGTNQDSLLGTCVVLIDDMVVGQVMYLSIVPPEGQPKFLGVTDLRNFHHQVPGGVKNVGKNLLAVAYRISQNCGFSGRMGLIAADEAVGFYQKIGFSHLQHFSSLMFLNRRGRRLLDHQLSQFT